ncbi:MAG: hypothetical protein WCO56_06920 [Verrucomicrobiota bacterium]
MGFWTNKVHRTAFDDAEDLAYAPSGGRLAMWLLGVGFALLPFGYGVWCLFTGHACFFGRGSSSLDLEGPAAVALAIAYLAVGVFIHAHWFWGLHPKLEPMSCLLKLLSVLVFIGCFGYTMYRIIL